MNRDPFGVLGLPARPDLTDDDVRAAWRRVAAATHPDRADGGDAERFAEASAAYAELRTRSGRGEACAGLSAGTRRRARTAAQTMPPAPSRQAAPPGPPARPSQVARPRQAAHSSQAAGLSQAARPRQMAGGRGRFGVASTLASRVGRGRPALLGLRLVIAAAVIAAVFVVTGVTPAAAGLATGVITWLVLTARHDLARPGGQSVPADRQSRKLCPCLLYFMDLC